MNPNKETARIAGLLYGLVGVTGAFGITIVPLTLIVRGDATATAERIRSSESLFRLGIASELIASVSFIFLVLALYRLFEGVSEARASLMVTLVLVSVPISFLNALDAIAALVFLSGPDYLSVFDRRQLDALALLFLGLHSSGNFVVAGIFWGLWLLPLGALVIGSGFAPRALGFLVILAGLAYVVASFTSLLLPQYGQLVSIVALPFEAGWRTLDDRLGVGLRSEGAACTDEHLAGLPGAARPGAGEHEPAREMVRGPASCGP